MVKKAFLVGAMLLLTALLASGCGVPQEDYDAVVAEKDSAQAELQSVRSELDTTQAELQSVRSELDTTQTELQSVRSELDTTQTELQSVRSELDTTQTELQAVRSELQSMRSQLAVARYTPEEVEYFLEIALGSEYSGTHPLAKWSGEIRISVFGDPTEEDLTTLDNVVDDINGLTGGQITLQVVSESPDITIRFIPLSEMPQYEAGYVPGNWGWFSTRWYSTYELYSANILISTDKPTQQERNHLIREELTQSLGLFNDSWAYPDSIFYQDWTATQGFSYIDRKVIEMLYSEEIQLGMNREQIESVFSY